MKIAALCDKDTAIGLRLAGITRIQVTEKETMIHDFDELITQKDIGIMFITETIASAMGKTLKDYRLTNDFPIIVEIPDKHGRQPDRVDFISHLVKRAVGIDVIKQPISPQKT